MSEGRIVDGGKSVVFNSPELEGISCEVQHSIASGKPFCPDPGMCGVGVVVLPTGQPRLVLQIKHHDGTSLSATLASSGATLALLECIVDAQSEAQDIADAAEKAVRQ